MVNKYELKKLAEGAIEIARDDGTLVPDDASNQEFLDFLTWNSMQMPIAYRDVCHFGQLYFLNEYRRSGRVQPQA